MVETRSAGFCHKKKGQAVELQVRRSDNYNDFAFKAATALKLQPYPCSSLVLFKVTGGAVILNEAIFVKKKSRPWTLGGYLSLLKKGSSSVKIGVGYVIDEEHNDRS